MDREGFRNRLKQYKKAREENPGLKYWEFIINNTDQYGNVVSTEESPIYDETYLKLQKQILDNLRVVDQIKRKWNEFDYARTETDKRGAIPFIEDKKITLSNAGKDTGVTLSTNLLDSIAKYADKADLPLSDALGLAGQESTFGKGYNSEAKEILPSILVSDWNYGNPTGRADRSENPYLGLWNTANRKVNGNQGFYNDNQEFIYDLNFINTLKGGIPFADKESDRLGTDMPVLEHAFKKFKSGKYNPKDSNHTKMVKERGKALMQSPEIQKWIKENNIQYAEGGEVGENNFMKQFGEQVSYKPEETSWWSDVKNWWNDLTGMKNYAYGNCATTPGGKHTKECAHYSNSILRNQGYKNIVGDAWTRAANSGMKKITSGYDGLTKPIEWNENDAHEYLQSAAENFASKIDTTGLKPYDVIGLYYPDSPNTKKAFEQGRWGETQTHTGHTVIGKDGTHYVLHNVDGHLKINKLADMLTGDYEYKPVSAYRPKKYAEGGRVEPDPLEVLERSRPKFHGIPISKGNIGGVFSPIDIPLATLPKVWPVVNKWLPNYGPTLGALIVGDNGQPVNKSAKPIATKRIEPDVEEFYRDIVIPF